MKNIFITINVTFYSFGTIFLPMSDFSVIGNLPKMYQHCRATEDKDMTPIDFITDHLINIDGILDKHQNGDEQKPHKSLEYNIDHSTFVFIQEFKPFEFKNNKEFVSLDQIKISNYENILYSFNAVFSIFRPPIVA